MNWTNVELFIIFGVEQIESTDVDI